MVDRVRLSLGQVANIIQSADGMRPYPTTYPESWRAFPQRTAGKENTRGIYSFLQTDNNFVKNQTSGGLTAREIKLFADQVVYEQLQFGIIHSSVSDSVRNFQAALNGQGIPAFDTNGNAQFDYQDAQRIARLDGNADNLTEVDLNAWLARQGLA